MADPLTSIRVEVPAVGRVDIDRLDADVSSVVERLGPPTVFDGTGNDGTGLDLFLYSDDPNAVIESLLDLEFPDGTIAHVATRDLARRSTTTHTVVLAGPGRGERSDPSTETSGLAEGDWFLYPLDDHQVLGRISHIGAYHMVVYFFGPRRHDRPTTQELVSVSTLGPADSIAYAMVMPTELEQGIWRHLGPEGRFDPSDWPLPDFEFVFTPNAKHYREHYDGSLDGKRTRDEIPEEEWWQRSETSLTYPPRLDGVLNRAFDDPANRYRMPPKDQP